MKPKFSFGCTISQFDFSTRPKMSSFFCWMRIDWWLFTSHTHARAPTRVPREHVEEPVIFIFLKSFRFSDFPSIQCQSKMSMRSTGAKCCDISSEYNSNRIVSGKVWIFGGRCYYLWTNMCNRIEKYYRKSMQWLHIPFVGSLAFDFPHSVLLSSHRSALVRFVDSSTSSWSAQKLLQIRASQRQTKYQISRQFPHHIRRAVFTCRFLVSTCRLDVRGSTHNHRHLRAEQAKGETKIISICIRLGGQTNDKNKFAPERCSAIVGLWRWWMAFCRFRLLRHLKISKIIFAFTPAANGSLSKCTSKRPNERFRHESTSSVDCVPVLVSDQSQAPQMKIDSLNG